MADVLFTHDCTSDEYFMGTQETVLAVAYTKNAMYVDQNIRYTGNWMKRFFGKVKEQRDTTHFLLDKNQIREIDWKKGSIQIYPFKKIKDSGWIKGKTQRMEGANEIIDARYKVLDPVFRIKFLPGTKKINGYECNKIEATLKLETRDIKKGAASITLIRQDLWVSYEVPGYDQFAGFMEKLAKKLGLEAARMGNLNFLLRYWHGSLDPIKDSLEKIKGYPVKNSFIVEAKYIKNIDDKKPEIIKKQIKKETITLKEVKVSDKLDVSGFMETGPFQEVIVK